MTPDVQTNDPYAIFQTGDRVKHPKFGDGQIIQRSGSGDATKLLVTFAEEGEKHLMARYANLKRIQPLEAKEAKEAAKVAASDAIIERAPKRALVDEDEEEDIELEDEELDVEVFEEELEEDEEDDELGDEEE